MWDVIPGTACILSSGQVGWYCKSDKLGIPAFAVTGRDSWSLGQIRPFGDKRDSHHSLWLLVGAGGAC